MVIQPPSASPDNMYDSKQAKGDNRTITDYESFLNLKYLSTEIVQYDSTNTDCRDDWLYRLLVAV